MLDTKRPQLWEWCLFGIAALGFVALFWGVTTNASWVKTFDQIVIQTVRFPQSPWKNTLVMGYTTCFNPVPLIAMILIGVAFLFIKHYYWATFFFLFTTVTGTILNSVVKTIVQRPRPTFEPLMHYGGFSFPSGHSSGSMLVLGCVMVLISSFVSRRWLRQSLHGILAILILLVGYSRIYVGVHYPSDVLAGYCLGYLVTFIGQSIFTYHHSAKKAPHFN